MTEQVAELVLESFSVAILLGLPLVLGALVASLMTAAIVQWTGLQDAGVVVIVRAVAVIGVLALVASSWASHGRDLAGTLWGTLAAIGRAS